ncbi:MAG: TIGR02391 family protein [Anaerolineae bacterium]|nr:TIGR02391 family protein [Anaerolineae bacterium]
MNLETVVDPALWSAIADSYEAEKYSHAIREAIYHLTDVLREKSGLDGDGVSLVGQALGGDSPKLKLNRFQTESDRIEQKGFVQILMGLYQAIRNPRAHGAMQDTKETADAIIHFVDYLAGILGRSEAPFTIQRFLGSVLDPDFVQTDSYAELLVAEIPVNKLYDCLVEVYGAKSAEHRNKVGHVVRAILKRLSDDQISDFLRIASNELRTTHKESVLIDILCILPPNLWSRIDKVAQMRIESKLTDSIAEGYVDPLSGELQKGALGTWARRFIPYFETKYVLEVVLPDTLDIDSGSRLYVWKYFRTVFPHIFDSAESRNVCVRHLLRAIRDGDEVLKEAMDEGYWGLPKEWASQIRDGLRKIEECDAEFCAGLDEEDIPF